MTDVAVMNADLEAAVKALEGLLRAFAAGLLELPGLRDTLWSNNDAGTRLLGEPLDESRR